MVKWRMARPKMAKLRMVKRRQFLGNLRTAFGDRSEATGLTQQGSLAVPQKHCVVDKGSFFSKCAMKILCSVQIGDFNHGTCWTPCRCLWSILSWHLMIICLSFLPSYLEMVVVWVMFAIPGKASQRPANGLRSFLGLGPWDVFCQPPESEDRQNRGRNMSNEFWLWSHACHACKYLWCYNCLLAQRIEARLAKRIPKTCCVIAWGPTRQSLVILLGLWNLWVSQKHGMCTCSPPFKKCLGLKQLVLDGSLIPWQVLVDLRLLLHGPGWGWLLTFLNKQP